MPETHETTQEQYEKWSFLNGITLKSTVPAIQDTLVMLTFIQMLVYLAFHTLYPTES